MRYLGSMTWTVPTRCDIPRSGLRIYINTHFVDGVNRRTEEHRDVPAFGKPVPAPPLNALDYMGISSEEDY